MKLSNREATDMMQRRTPLPLGGNFVVSGRAVVIHTNCAVILREACKASLLTPVGDAQHGPAMQWEIVGSLDTRPVEGWDSNVTLAGRSLYLSMGPQQWFAFDLETHQGAGFVTVCATGPNRNTNTQRYLLSIARNVTAGLRSEVGIV